MDGVGRVWAVSLTLYERCVTLLPLGTKGLPEDEQVELIGITIGFQLLQQGRGEEPFAGKEEGPVFFGEEIVAAGMVKVQGHRFRCEWAFKDCKQAGAFGLPGDGDELAARKGFAHAFEGRAGDMGRGGEVVVVHGPWTFAAVHMPEPQVDGVVGRGKGGKEGLKKHLQFQVLSPEGCSDPIPNRGQVCARDEARERASAEPNRDL